MIHFNRLYLFLGSGCRLACAQVGSLVDAAMLSSTSQQAGACGPGPESREPSKPLVRVSESNCLGDIFFSVSKSFKLFLLCIRWSDQSVIFPYIISRIEIRDGKRLGLFSKAVSIHNPPWSQWCWMRNRGTGDQEASSVGATRRGKAVGKVTGVSRAFGTGGNGWGRPDAMGSAFCLIPAPSNLDKMGRQLPGLHLRKGTNVCSEVSPGLESIRHRGRGQRPVWRYKIPTG